MKRSVFVNSFRWILPLICSLLATGCGSGSTEKTEDSAAVVPSEEEDEEVIESLPDTCFPSVSKIHYVIEIADTSLNPHISSLKNLYAGSNSVLTFRNGPMRQGDFKALLDSMPTRFELDWTIETELEHKDTVYGPWGGGTGWTGQPLYLEWPDSIAEAMKNNSAVTAAFTGKELIFGSLCGKLYFLNPIDGKPTREPIDVGNPIKGTPSVDPTFNGNIYVGQGVPATRPFGAVAFNLITNKKIDFKPEDQKAWRSWGAYDSSPVRVGEYLFRPAENGGIYKYYIAKDGEMKLQSVMRYRVNGVAPGIESSMSIYSNYGFVTDNHGNIIAINLDNLKPVWYYSIDDDTDATPVVSVEDNHPYLYVGCEIDRVERSYTKFAKLDALTGRKIWEITPEGKRFNIGKKHFDGGFYASPLLGTGDCEDLIFTNMVKNTKGQNGVFLAIDRKDGRIVYEIPLRCYSWSSPAGLLTKAGQMAVVTADGAGNLYLIEGKSGKILTSERIGFNFESSPILTGNSVYIGSRTNGLNKVKLL